jgi:hypothetical protein
MSDSDNPQGCCRQDSLLFDILFIPVMIIGCPIWCPIMYCCKDANNDEKWNGYNT